MAYYSKQQAKALLSGTAPQNRGAVVKKLIAQGDQFEGLNATVKPSGVIPTLANEQASAPANTFKNPGSEFQRPTIENIGRGIQEMGAGGLQAFSEGIGNTAKAGMQALEMYGDMQTGRALMPQQFRDQVNAPLRAVGDFAQKGGQWFGRNVMEQQEKFGLDTKSGATMVGQGLGAIAAEVPAIIAGSAVTNKVKLGLKGVKETPKLLKSVIGNVAGGTISTAGATAGIEGRLPKAEELAMGGGIDVAATLLPAVLKKLSKNAYDKLLGIPRGEAGKLADKGIDVSGALSKKGYVAGSRISLSKKIGKDIGGLSDQLDDLIKKADVGDTKALAKYGDTFDGFKFKADNLLDGAENYALNSDKLKPKFGEMKAVKKQIQSSIDEFMETVGDRNLKLTDVQTLKKKLGNSLSGFFAKAGDAKATARELVNDAIRKNAKGIIETNVKGAKGLNKAMSPLIEAQKILKKKGDYSGTLGDLLIGGLAGSGSLVGGSKPEDAVINILKALALKRGLMSPFGRSLRGSVLGKLGKAAGNKMARQGLKNLIPLFSQESNNTPQKQ